MKKLIISIAMLAIFALAGCQGGSQSNGEPSALIVGDSVSLGYTPHVQVEGATVEHNGQCDSEPYDYVEGVDPHNGEGSSHQAACIKTWLAQGSYSIVHFNAGLWDVSNCKWHLNSDLSDYLSNLQQILDAIRAAGAVPIFATTTPAPDGTCVDPADVVRYNAAAVAMMRSQGVQIDDLYNYVKPVESTYQAPDNVHFTDAGYEYLAKQVSAAIASAH